MVSGLGNKVCNETVRKLLKKRGYKFLHYRKKGLLKPKDLNKRLKFSRNIKGIFKKNIWTEGISLYLDEVGYQHKYDPFDEAKSFKSMTWWQQSKGLDPLCTAKGSYTGSGGRIAHFIVAISFNKGVIVCERYFWKIIGEMFADFIHKHFKEALEKSNNPKNKLFLQDGNPSQNSRKANNAMYKMGSKKFNIPAQSPDLNPIENVFHYARTKWHEESLNRNITFQNFDEYSTCVKKTLLSVPVEYINKTTESMDNRLSMVVKKGGKQIKY